MGGRIGFDVCYKGSLLGLSLKNKKSRIGFGSIPTEKYVRGVRMCHLSLGAPKLQRRREGPLEVDIYNFIKDSAATIAVLNAAAVDGSENKIEPLDDANLSKSD